MIKSNRFSLPLFCAALLSVHPSIGLAIDAVDYGAVAEVANRIQSQAPCSYGRKINEKGLRTVANLFLGLAEVPRGIVNVTNDSNIFFGLTGGLLKGVINTTGRLGAGVVDLMTLPVPTKPIVHPLYAWEDFDQDTRYDSLFRADKCPDDDAVVGRPVAAAKPAVVQAPPGQPMPNRGIPEQNNRKIDTLFQQRMLK